MKQIIWLGLLLSISPAYADDPYSYPAKNRERASSNVSDDKQLEYSLPNKEDINRTTPESVRYYLKSGYSIGSINGGSLSFLPTALGTRRYADEFFYGFEFSSHYANPQQLLMTNFNMGHHFLTWRHRVKPFISANFGYAHLKNKDNSGPTGGGISIGTEIGFDLFKAGPLIFSASYKYDHVMINNNQIKGINVQNLFLSVGMGF